jgi:hypothetical protein
MTQEFIPYEQALALKGLGFDEPCFAFYDESLYFPNNKNQYGTFCNQPLDASSCTAPLYQQAFRWFREKYDLNIFVYANTHISIELSLTEPKKYFYLIDIDTEERSEESKDFNTYEEAELACLKKLIEIVKNK